MSDKPNAFTAGPALTWASSNPKRPDLAPRKSGIALHGSDTANRARSVLTDSQMDVLDRWKRRVSRG